MDIYDDIKSKMEERAAKIENSFERELHLFRTWADEEIKTARDDQILKVLETITKRLDAIEARLPPEEED